MEARQVLITQFEQERISNLVWRKEWINKFISLWGIIERFKYANSATDKDIVHLFGTEEESENSPKKLSRNLINMQGLNKSRIAQVFGLDVIKNMNIFMDYFILSLNQGDFNEQFFRTRLAFCPKCLEAGYHSLFHQYALLDICPFHRAKLIFECPQCKLQPAYELNVFKSPFQCKCGYSFIPVENNHFIYQWDNVNDLKISIPQIRSWINLSSDQVEKVKSIYVVPENCISMKHTTLELIIKWISNKARLVGAVEASHITLSECKPCLPPNKTVKKLTSYLQQEVSHCGKDEYLEKSIIDRISFQQYIRLYLLQSYKSIARYLRKKRLVQHKHCIKIYKTNCIADRIRVLRKQLRTVCPYAIAYVWWRREMEGLSYPWMVETICSERKELIPQIKIDPLFLSPFIYSKKVKQILLEINDIENNPKLWAKAKWMLNRLFCEYALYRFNQWLDITHRYNKNLKLKTYEKRYPFFILDFPNTIRKNHTIRFNFLNE